MNWLILRQRHPDPQLQTFWDGIQLSVLLMPFSSLLGSVGISLISLMIVALRFKAIARRPINRGLCVVALLMVISTVFAYYKTEAVLGLANFLPLFIVFAALSELIQTPAQLRRLAWIMVSASVPVVLIGLGQQFGGWAGQIQILGSIVNWKIDPTGNPPGRMSSIFFYANVLASYLIVTFTLSLGLLVEGIVGRWGRGDAETRRHGDAKTFQALTTNNQELTTITPYPVSHLLFLTLALLGNAIALVFTNSRNAWAVTVIACLVFAIYLGWRWLLAIVAGIAGGILGAAFSPSPLREWLRAIVPAFFWARLTDQLYPNRLYAELRTTQWQFAWSLAQQRPWTGWGLRNFSPIYESQMHFFIGHPHNLMLMLAAETGIPTTLLFYSLVSWVVYQGILLLQTRNQHSPKTQNSKLKTQNSPPSPSPSSPSSSSSPPLLFTYLIAFLSCAGFSLLDITLFDIRINLFGWLLLAGICGLVYRLSNR